MSHAHRATDQERLLVQQGQPVEVTDPSTNEAYVLLARDRFEQVRQLLPQPAAPSPQEPEIPEGIRLSQAAFRRDLPGLLQQRKLVGRWVAYHRNECVGIASQGKPLLEKCLGRGLSSDEFFVGWIDASGLEIDEEVEPRLEHFVEAGDANP